MSIYNPFKHILALAFNFFLPILNAGVREQVNERTSFVDGSMIYGSDADRERELRATCKLRLGTACVITVKIGGTRFMHELST